MQSSLVSWTDKAKLALSPMGTWDSLMCSGCSAGVSCALRSAQPFLWLHKAGAATWAEGKQSITSGRGTVADGSICPPSACLAIV